MEKTYRVACPGGIMDYSVALIMITHQLGIKKAEGLEKLNIKYKKDKPEDPKYRGFSFSFMTDAEIDLSPLERAGLSINSF